MTKNLRALVAVIKRLYDCRATHRESVPVVERFQGQVIWDGVVEVFDVEGHPKATRCYAWSFPEGLGTRRLVAILHLPPVDSPEAAVKVFLVVEARNRRL